MTKLTTLIFLFLTSHFLFAQITFKKGYVIDNQNKRIECLIKDNDWRNNPQVFNYQISQSSEVLKGNLDNISEFGIYGKSNFKRAEIELDVSTDELSRLTYDKNPTWEKRKVFLKFLVDGEAKLYSYIFGASFRYYYSTGISNKIVPLIFKKYRSSKGISENLSFKQELISQVNCGNQDLYVLNTLKYSEEMLIKFFAEFNACRGGDSGIMKVIASENKRRDFIKSNLNLGFGYSKLTLKHINGPNPSRVWDNSIEYRIGIRSAFILPFRMNKWSIVIDPHFYYNPKVREDTRDIYESEFKYFTLPFGVSHKAFLNNGSNLNFSLLHNVGTNKSDPDVGALNLSLRPARMLNVDIGYEKKKLGVFVRYYTSSIFKTTNTIYYRTLNGFQVVFKYNFLSIQAKR